EKKIVFLDRDGVINRDIDGGYVTCWAEFEFLPGVLDSLRVLAASGYTVAVISNQAGVGKGMYSEQALADITARMCRAVTEAGGCIERTWYCLHRPDAGCACRKPNPGMLREAAAVFRVSPQACIFIGDSERDIIAGRTFGCRTVLVLSGKIKNRGQAAALSTAPDYICDDLRAAVEIVLPQWQSVAGREN
ncbi:MAG: HAD-IIIA family hydrolase, partial [Candidatus Omnitrophica bacterium]|nr:HAD-IIIA family hydrolase [Candidatus Omnitrophota bacterium]